VRHTNIIMGFMVSFIFLCNGCGSGNSGDSGPKPVHVASISLDRSSAVMLPKDTIQLLRFIEPSDATDMDVRWSSSNTSVATVSFGLITAIAKGTAIITVTTTDGNKQATCEVTVPGGSPAFQWAVAGEDNNQAVLWTDSATYTLGNNAIAKSVAIADDGTLYIAGEQDDYPVLWVGDTLSKYPLGDTLNKSQPVYKKGGANHVLSHGNDFYVAGKIGDRATYWKNGVSVISTANNYPDIVRSEAKSIGVDSTGYIQIVGSGFTASSNEYAVWWLPSELGISSIVSVYSETPGTTLNKCLFTKDDTLLIVGIGANLTSNGIRGPFASVLTQNRTDGSGQLIPDNPAAFDVIPLDFKSESSKDNSGLLATALGIYKFWNMPNKAYFDAHGFTLNLDSMHERLPGYGYTKSLALKGTDIYAAGKNENGAVIWKNGTVLRQLSPTAEPHSLVVR